MSDGDGAGRGSAPPFVVLEGITKRFPGVVADAGYGFSGTLIAPLMMSCRYFSS
jgi:hypothetical protein